MSDDFDAMADLCIEAATVIMQAGSPELKVAAQMLLVQLGRDLVRREAEQDVDASGSADE